MEINGYATAASTLNTAATDAYTIKSNYATT